MTDTKKVRKIIALSTGAAALSLSASTIVLLEQTSLANQKPTAVQAALRDGAVKDQAQQPGVDKPSWINVARDND
jgi:hypothetical protein